MFLAESLSELCVLADFKGTLNTTVHDNNVIQQCTANYCVFKFNSRTETGPAFSSPALYIHAFSVLHFPVLHFSTLEIWSLIFQSCRSLFDLIGPSLVPHSRSYIFSRPILS